MAFDIVYDFAHDLELSGWSDLQDVVENMDISVAGILVHQTVIEHSTLMY